MVNGTDRQLLQAPMERLVKRDGIWGEKWKLEDKVDELLAATASILNEDGFLILNTYSPTVDQETLKELMTIYFPQRAASADGLHMKTTSGKHLYFGELVRVGKTI